MKKLMALFPLVFLLALSVPTILANGEEDIYTIQERSFRKDFTPTTIQPEDDRIEVSIEKQRLYIIEQGREIFQCKVSTGEKKGYTRVGSFRVFATPTSTGSPYGGTMTNVLFFTHGNKGHHIGIHGLRGGSYERKLGTPASHGCIRVSRKDSEFIYQWEKWLKGWRGTHAQVYVY